MPNQVLIQRTLHDLYVLLPSTPSIIYYQGDEEDSVSMTQG